jgi:ribonuclease PH
MEIQRLVGRSLRCVTDLSSFGERTVTVDCDVIQADGGTRTASITGAWVALHDAFATLIESGVIAESPLKDIVAAVSVGVVANELILDPDYDEDSAADVDMNVVMTGDGRLVELQATAERIPFSVARMNALVVMAQDALAVVNKLQLDACGIEPYHST